MSMRRFVAHVVVLAVVALAGSALFSAPSAKAKAKVPVPPPRFAKSVVDVFFEDARKQLVGERPDFTKAGAPAGAANVAGPGGGNAPAAGGGFAWSKLISSDALESEIKNKTADLAPDVATPGKFNSAVKKFRNSFSVLAAMFGIVAGYDGDVRWKDVAASMRDAVGRAGKNCKVASPQSFGEAKARHTDITELIGGGKPTLGEPQEDFTWEKVADLTELMKRIEEANDTHLKPWSGNKGDFTSNKDQFQHEAEVLAALAHVIQDPAYVDDEEFRKFAASLQEGALEMVEGAKAGDFERAQKGAGVTAKACVDCHGSFR